MWFDTWIGLGIIPGSIINAERSIRTSESESISSLLDRVEETVLDKRPEANRADLLGTFMPLYKQGVTFNEQNRHFLIKDPSGFGLADEILEGVRARTELKGSIYEYSLFGAELGVSLYKTIYTDLEIS